MNARRIAIRERSLAVLAINEAAIFEIAKSKTDCNTADVKLPAKLVLAGNWERRLFVFVQYFLSDRVYKPGPSG